MPQATITTKGQVTIPKDIRDRMGIGPGDRIDFLLEPNGTVRVRRIGKSILDLAGILHRPGMGAISVERMDEGIADYVSRDNERIRKGRK